MRRSRRNLVGLLILAATFWLGGQKPAWVGHARQLAARGQPGLYAVTAFVDGDTIAVDMNGKAEKVRLIGVDTPETHKPDTPVQCYGPAAAAFTKQAIGGQKVRLVSDPLSTDRDRYDRLLRYVYLPDDTNLDEKLIQEGYGFYYPYFPFTKSERFAVDERAAQAANKGLWGSCHPTPTDSGGYVSNPQN